MYDLVCSRCNNPFQSIQSFAKVCPECKKGHCVICGKSFSREWPYDQQTCSSKCRKEYRRSHEIIQKTTNSRIATLRERYGVDNVSSLQSVRDKISKANSSEEVRNRREQTCLEKFGVKHPFQNPDVYNKFQQTCIERFGAPHPTMNQDVKNKIAEVLSSEESMNRRRETLMSRYGVTCTNNIPGVRDKMIQTTMEHYGVPYFIFTEMYKHPEKSNVISKVNRRIASIFNEKGIETEFEFNIETKSYDIHILNTNILIEVDPTYTHNAIGNHWDKEGTDKYYHLNKTTVANNANCRCIHIFDWDDLDKIVNMLKPKISVYARKCKIRLIDKSTADAFVNIHHLQGKCSGTKYSIGLYYQDELVQVMTFGKSRYNKKYEWELLRLCTDSRYRVIGGASKLMNKFVQDNYPSSIISYCDISKFNGHTYYQLGMTLDHISEPSKVWSKGTDKITDNLLRQRGYDQLFKTNFGKGTNNEELMIKDDWLPVYDCGQYVFTRVWKHNSLEVDNYDVR